MPVSIVVGGQFGSEGKGKVALEIARRSPERVVAVRVGGSNSGHTAYDREGTRWALRHMPASCVDGGMHVVFPAGSYLDINVLLAEIDALKYPKDYIHISPFARVVTDQHKGWEAQGGLTNDIGSTGSGVGAAVIASAARGSKNLALESPLATDYDVLSPFLSDSVEFMRAHLDGGGRVIIEGTQGFGLSLLDGGYWPKATARSTTASAALAETGLSPFDVDEIVLVLRTFPIRVAGSSGPLLGETTWEEIADAANLQQDIREFTTVTGRLRRVGKFDPALVRRALLVNRPSKIVLNHLDYVGREVDLRTEGSPVRYFLDMVQKSIGRRIDAVGFSPTSYSEMERAR
jgi:adenylosuccinate synthase